MSDPKRNSLSRNLPLDDNPIGKNHELLTIRAIERHSDTPTFLMKREQRKVVQGNVITELRQGFEYRQQALRMALDTRLQAMEEHCNHVLVTGKAQYRRERNNFFASQLVELQQQMNELADKFNRDVDQRMGKLDSYQNEHLKRREQERLEKSIDDFMDTVDALMESFKSIFNSQVNRQEV